MPSLFGSNKMEKYQMQDTQMDFVLGAPSPLLPTTSSLNTPVSGKRGGSGQPRRCVQSGRPRETGQWSSLRVRMLRCSQGGLPVGAGASMRSGVRRSEFDTRAPASPGSSNRLTCQMEEVNHVQRVTTVKHVQRVTTVHHTPWCATQRTGEP